MTDEELLQKQFNQEDFDPFKGKDFRVRLEGGIDASLTLDAIETLPPIETSKPNIRKDPFSLLFWGPADKTLENALYHLTPEGGEPCILYLDKKDLDEEKGQILYEAIFA